MAEALNVFSSYEESTARMETCEGCENLQVTKQCAICHCFMPAKVRLARSSCPKGLW
jgi:recombinational DNA repair protein RecR